MLNFLLNDLYYLWKEEDIVIIVREIIHSNWVGEAMKIVIKGKCFKTLLNEYKD